MKKTVFFITYWLIQLSWGILQSIIGFAVFLWCLRDPHFIYHGAIATRWHYGGGVSLGLFIFYQGDDERMLKHEYGHTVQSAILGPLYLAVIGLPSALWCNLPYFERMRRERHISYDTLYTEKWATGIGRKIS